MDLLQQRKLGLQIAKELGAGASAVTIADQDACYSRIMTIAAAEIGAAALAEQLRKGPPVWALEALKALPDLGDHREALLARLAEQPDVAREALRSLSDLGGHRTALEAAAGPQAAISGTIAGFNLKNEGGYTCSFTVMWLHQGQIMPSAVRQAMGDWTWTGDILTAQSSGNRDVRDFATNGALLGAGDTVWLRMFVSGGRSLWGKEAFTYDPTSTVFANYTAHGTSLNDKLDYQVPTS